MCTQLLLAAIRDDVAFSFAVTLQDDGIDNLSALFGRRIRRALIRNGTLPSTLTRFGDGQFFMFTSSAFIVTFRAVFIGTSNGIVQCAACLC